ncbi:MAG: hypothetical protein HY269_10610, partial [Deltaproteobacteria bacterium]|nr:hypothetical protein [Deltaproteobacteria bacterium]
RLEADRDASGEHCPDSSIISAYRDRGLGLHERAFWERHFAQCARCTGAIAALARIDDADNAGDAVEGDLRTAADERRVWWSLRGAFPVAAMSAAAAFAIVIAIRTIEYKHRSTVVADQAAENYSQLASKAAPADKPSEADKTQERQMAMNDAAPAAASPSSMGALSKGVSSSRPAASRRKEEARSSLHDELSRKVRAKEFSQRKAEAGNYRLNAASNSADTIAPVPSAAPNQVAAAAPPVGDSEGVGAAPMALESASGGVAGGSNAVGSMSPSPVEKSRADRSSSGAGVGVDDGAMGSVVAPIPAAASGEREASDVSRGVKVESPDHSVVWMLGRHGEIMRYSTATGWVPQTSGVANDFVAGSAPSTPVCWAVGRGGTIVRTIDGEHWTKIASPVTGDLIGVAANSANNATITTAKGERYSTSDGGVRWQPQ